MYENSSDPQYVARELVNDKDNGLLQFFAMVWYCPLWTNPHDFVLILSKTSRTNGNNSYHSYIHDITSFHNLGGILLAFLPVNFT